MNKRLKILLSIGLTLVGLLIGMQLFLGPWISSKVETALVELSDEKRIVEVDKVRFNLFRRTLNIDGLHWRPSESELNLLKEGKHPKGKAYSFSVQSIRLSGIRLLRLVMHKDIHIRELALDKIEIDNQRQTNVKQLRKSEGRIQLDSLHIPGIEGFRLDRIAVGNLHYQDVNAASKEIEFSTNQIDFDLNGFKLERLAPETFAFKPLEDRFLIEEVKIRFPDKFYRLKVGSIAIEYESRLVTLSDLHFNSTIDKKELASRYAYNREVFNLSVGEIRAFDFDFDRVLKTGAVYIDSLALTALDVDVFMDKRKPFDERRRPLFPHNALKRMKFPLKINDLTLEKSSLFYEEKIENEEIPMRINLQDWRLQARNVTSIEAFRKEPLDIDMQANLINKAPLKVHLSLPLRSDRDVFYFEGSLGAVPLRYFDTALVPALGLKVLEGEVEQLTFEAYATTYSSKGTMTMRYTGLEGEVLKIDSTEKSKFWSWSLNQFVHRSNPGNNGKLRVAIMEFDRVLYKGFGNFLWKTLQSGIVNSIVPIGSTVEKQNKKLKRREKREARRQKKKAI